MSVVDKFLNVVTSVCDRTGRHRTITQVRIFLPRK